MERAEREDIRRVVQEVLREGDFVMSAAYDHMTIEEYAAEEQAFHTRVESRQQTLEEHLGEVANVLLGTQRTEFQGGGREEDGMCHRMDILDSKVESIDTKLSNGGLKVKLPWQFYGALVGAVSAILVAWIQTH